MAVDVIDLLEAVDIDHHAAKLEPISNGAFELLVEGRIQLSTVVQAGERIRGALAPGLGDGKGVLERAGQVLDDEVERLVDVAVKVLFVGNHAEATDALTAAEKRHAYGSRGRFVWLLLAK
jgi:hypothetical protein